MSKILRDALPIAFIVVVYTGEPEGTLFDYHALTLIPALMRIFLLFARGGANTANSGLYVRSARAIRFSSPAFH